LWTTNRLVEREWVLVCRLENIRGIVGQQDVWNGGELVTCKV